MFEMGLDKNHLTLIHSNKTPAKTFESAFIKFAINKYFMSIGVVVPTAFMSVCICSAPRHW